MNNAHLIEIKSDLYDIGERLREIDAGYYVVYNKREQRYEVFHRGHKADSLAFVVPHKSLDCRTLAIARSTSVSRLDEIIKELRKGEKIYEPKKYN